MEDGSNSRVGVARINDEENLCGCIRNGRNFSRSVEETLYVVVSIKG